ncbi:GNAT family N-acetyltransferase [Jannaschia pohangensis]|uniref:Protein N-acetyltransferase, RimJ/RimL family n=1 Tax=Jannaschia pohangensis TaxID=390807 RepID=A0A1I3QPN0_9RHOB|nr:GNAT family N-acetyltransferase [Jannaschia pohangensis]SFJ35479.1 Protein N-acetyltransferase, RimJ/RimL family [Jannaschia pohangensis]
MTVPTLTTARLTLRLPELRDHAAYAAFYASPRSEIIGGPLDETRAWKVLSNDVGHWHLRGFGWWALDDGNGCIGTCGFHLPAGRRDVELGWSLFSATGRGFATEAARAALAWAGARWSRVVSNIDPRNDASERVADRLGAVDTGEHAAHAPECKVWLHREAAA